MLPSLKNELNQCISCDLRANMAQEMFISGCLTPIVSEQVIPHAQTKDCA